MIGSFLVAALAAATVRVDFGAARGEIKLVHGVNCSPMRHETVDKVYNQSQTELAASGVPYCRLHDVAGRYGLHHYVDIPYAAGSDMVATRREDREELVGLRAKGLDRRL